MPDFEFTDREVEQLRQKLGDWYARHRRELPWRGIDDPYKTWIAEIMLQQTQVATVVDYYENWLERFPDVDAVADSEVDEVLEAWEGLGYYRRARYIHRSARTIVEDYGGDLPEEADELEELPGIGPYTAGAIASIAFDEPEPVVDGNVSRVLSRLRAIEGDPKSTDNKKIYWRLADRLVDPEAPGDFNQAVMELGATVCTPTDPNCLLCPIREECEGFERGDPEQYPDTASRARQKPVHVQTGVLLAHHDTGTDTYVMKRPADGLLGGLWEFPTVEVGDGDDGDELVAAFLADELDLPDFVAAEVREVDQITHLFSHLRMTIDIRIRELEVDESLAVPVEAIEEAGAGWLGLDRLEEVPMSAAMRRVESHL
ncbi:MAG: A/G-specific adenine glycosylase [Bradymonadaceae bacterium]